MSLPYAPCNFRLVTESATKYVVAVSQQAGELLDGLTKPAVWAVSTAYAVGDEVTVSTNAYRCVRAHESLTGDVADGSPVQTNQTGWTLIGVTATVRPLTVQDVSDYRGVTLGNVETLLDNLSDANAINFTITAHRPIPAV